MRNDAPALPGLEDLSVPMNSRPADVDMTDEKVFTAAVLFRDHKDMFKSICIALFKHSLPVSWIAEMFRVSEHTVRAVSNYMLESPSTDAGRAAFFIKQGVNKSRLIANKTALDLLRRKMDEHPDSLSVADILLIISATNEKSEDRRISSNDVIDVESVDQFDDLINGLDEDKKSATSVPDGKMDGVEREDTEPTEGGSERIEDAGERSTESTSDGSAHCDRADMR